MTDASRPPSSLLVFESHVIRRAAGALVSFSLAACSGASPAAGTDAPAAPPAASFALTFAHAVCDDLAGCCHLNGFPFDAASCLTTAEAQAHTVLIDPALTAGATYDPSAASLCLSDVAAASRACNDALPTNAWAASSVIATNCTKVYAGTKAPGETCSSDYECAPGPAGSAVSCVGWLAENAEGVTTSAGHICQVVVPGTVGATCGSSISPPPSTIADCDSAGLTCSWEGSCQPRLAVGERCVGASDCVATAWCSAGVCAAQLGEGMACDPYAGACATGLYCSATSSTCVRLGGAGTSCSADVECDGMCDPSGTCSTSSIASATSCGG